MERPNSFLRTLSYVLLFICVFVGAFWLFRGSLSKSMLSSAAHRRVSYICIALEEKKVTKEEVCNIPITQIPALKQYFKTLRVEDEEWFKRHGWLYYPTVKCDEEKIRFFLMNYTLHCDGNRAVTDSQ